METARKVLQRMKLSRVVTWNCISQKRWRWRMMFNFWCTVESSSVFFFWNDTEILKRGWQSLGVPSSSPKLTWNLIQNRNNRIKSLWSCVFIWCLIMFPFVFLARRNLLVYLPINDALSRYTKIRPYVCHLNLTFNLKGEDVFSFYWLTGTLCM